MDDDMRYDRPEKGKEDFSYSNISDDEEEFDDTEIETPVRLVSTTRLDLGRFDLPAPQPQRSGTTNYTKFRTLRRSPLRNPPIVASESAADKTSTKTDKPAVNGISKITHEKELPHSPPSNLKFNNSALSPPAAKKLGLILEPSEEQRPRKQIRKMLERASSDITEEPSFHKPDPIQTDGSDNRGTQSPGVLADVSREIIIEKVNDTINSLMQSKNKKPHIKVNADVKIPPIETKNDEISSEEEPELQVHHWSDMPEMLGVSTPLVERPSRKRNRSSIEDPVTTLDTGYKHTTTHSNWWPRSKWDKLLKIVLSKHIDREEAINSPLLMSELGCKSRVELENRYDFLVHYKLKAYNGHGNNGRASGRSQH
ncbi:uncharacterized protein SPAPADRAFT_50725 [Spathaspora passalidarum NRRL Y-27907]|uniref:Uncharacterized protein n=1 Tax=Spathaspora passalidarum (strain NRRL Y-27907 / 11-Y1) TaxID=619300 RepID=G3APF9_SPAPN|nr:uncharacterized protein SPAPADRAFT_50725 [Spathaspora passalidarum NRRL Y-27907]EGW32136.1 hypothetical protein SPAPADRAFT_50725 [Spathaspora passalidarum NRRL Y-27907]